MINKNNKSEKNIHEKGNHAQSQNSDRTHRRSLNEHPKIWNIFIFFFPIHKFNENNEPCEHLWIHSIIIEKRSEYALGLELLIIIYIISKSPCKLFECHIHACCSLRLQCSNCNCSLLLSAYIYNTLSIE